MPLASHQEDAENAEENSKNLLDLPNEMLCIIFGYSKNLKELLLVNRNFNKTILKTTRLMKLLNLVFTRAPNDVDVLQACNRQYENLKVTGKRNVVMLLILSLIN